RELSRAGEGAALLAPAIRLGRFARRRHLRAVGRSPRHERRGAQGRAAPSAGALPRDAEGTDPADGGFGGGSAGGDEIPFPGAGADGGLTAMLPLSRLRPGWLRELTARGISADVAACVMARTKEGTAGIQSGGGRVGRTVPVSRAGGNAKAVRQRNPR